ncbi:BLUF domain-containing protein [Sphingomonas aerolata]|uniref:BLUF domain-containing protein n=1 Tax=Sphingomonas aerolata TaxID=185951 RepID=UPI003A5BADFA
MQTIIYISRAKQNFTSGDLADLRDLADARNRSEDITGLLLSDGTRFHTSTGGRRCRSAGCDGSDC